jgi:hypothetical protein
LVRACQRPGRCPACRTADLLGALRDLESSPEEESATFKRIRQARRHDIWRVAHPFDPAVAVRILCWFPADLPEAAVVALVGGDKLAGGTGSVIQDLWYDSATPRAEAAVDRWPRDQAVRKKQDEDTDEENHDGD